MNETHMKFVKRVEESDGSDSGGPFDLLVALVVIVVLISAGVGLGYWMWH